MPDRPSASDARIDALTAEIDHLRRSRAAADNQHQQVLLKMTEVQLNLATQDKTLARLDCAIHGNNDGKAGLLTRVDRVERTAAALIRFGWLVVATLATVAADLAMRAPR